MKKILALFIFFIFISSQFLHSQEKDKTLDKKHPILTSKLELGLGMFIPSQKVKFSLNVYTDGGINFGDSFDFNNSGVRPQAYFNWRFAKFWRLNAEYFNASYSDKRVLSEDIVTGDITFKEGSSVEVGYKLNMYRIYVGRVISSGEKHELGGGLGLHLLNIGPYIQANIEINDTETEFEESSVTLTAPLPNIALWYYFAPNEKWAFTARLDWLGVSIDGIGGTLWDFGPSIRYNIIENLAVSIDYRYFELNIDVKKDYWRGTADLKFNGPSITFIGKL